MPGEAIDSNDRALRLVAAIMATRDTEIDCERFQAVVAEYVDLEVAGGDPAAVEEGLPLHAGMCPECAELYNALLRVARLEDEGALPQADELWFELDRLAHSRQPRGIGLASGAPTTVSAGPESATVVNPATAAVVSPAPGTQAKSKAGSRPSSQPRFRLPNWTSRPALGMAAMTAVVLIGFAGLAMRNGGPTSGSAPVAMVRQAEMEGGGMVRVSFSPEEEQFTITADDMRTPMKRLKCWLVDQEGARQEARLDWESQADSWTGWADRPMRDFVLLSLIRMPEQSEVARISLR